MSKVAKNASHVDRPVFPESSSGIALARLHDPGLRQELELIVRHFFSRSTEYYVGLHADEYRAIVSAAQDEVNRRGLAHRIARDQIELIKTVLRTERPMVQSNAYLRATRPRISNAQENVGWHRESFYGPNMTEAINLWMPILNVSSDNTLHYIPDTHTIPDSEIQTVSEADPSLPRFSAGHRIGLLYAPKKIVSGVDFSTSRPFVVLPGEAAIFAASLIHGSAENRSDSIRFSLDIRMAAQESIIEQKVHFASGSNYFSPL